MRRAIFLFVVLAVLAPALPAAAHQPVSARTYEVAAPDLREVISAAAQPDGPPWVALVLAAAAALLIAWRPRRTIPVMLMLVAAVLAFETGVHSTHHLGQDSTSCSVASFSSQASATIGGMVFAPSPLVVPAGTVSHSAVPVLVVGVLAPDAGRAPPASSA